MVVWWKVSGLDVVKTIDDLPIGTAADVVVERMEQRGFTCQRDHTPGFNLALSLSLEPFRYERWSYSIVCSRPEPATGGWSGASHVIARMDAGGLVLAGAETNWQWKATK